MLEITQAIQLIARTEGERLNMIILHVEADEVQNLAPPLTKYLGVTQPMDRRKLALKMYARTTELRGSNELQKLGMTQAMECR